MFCVALVMRSFVGRPPGSQNESAVRQTADRHYARMRWIYPVVALGAGPMLFSPANTYLDRNSFSFYELLVVAIALALAILRGFGWSGTFRRGLDDELAQALRARAARFGYALAVAILVLACVYARYRPVSADRLLLRILFITSLTPVLFFLFLEWQSGRNG